MNPERANLRRKVFEAARDGIDVTLNALLTKIPRDEVKSLLDGLIEEGQMECTPLIIASMNGHENILKLLLKNYRPNVEVEGAVEFGGYLIEGTTALWCAAGFGHINCVRTLVGSGADVDHPTKAFSTPLRAACFDGRLDIVRFLVEHGADVNIPNKFSNSCLMIAAYKGHLSIIEYLLSLNCDPDGKAKCGGTALHFAAETGHLEIFKCLLEHGAQLSKNSFGMTPLNSAAERTKGNIVEYLVSTDHASEMEKIEALELLGASYANDKDNYSRERAYHYLTWAMRERFKNPQNPRIKTLGAPIPAYGDRPECSSISDLERIRTDCCALHMEGLIVRERILGRANPEVAHPVVYRGALYADGGRFDRCIPLWMHALMLKKDTSTSIRKDLLRFALVFCQMLKAAVAVPFDTLCDLLEIVVGELRSNKAKLDEATDQSSKKDAQDELDENILRVLYLVVIADKVSGTTQNDELDYRLCKLVYQLNKLHLRTTSGATLLHLTANGDTPVDDARAKTVIKFPCSSTAKLLIKCGFDVNATDNKRNTPLHVIVSYQKPISDFLTLHSMVTLFVNAGAHADYVNHRGLTPFESASTGVAEIILRSEYRITSLSCLAARAVGKNNISLETLSPPLKEFVRRHTAS